VAGDVTGKSFLAHTGSAQGMQAVNHMKGIHEEFDFKK
jgi:hypothetical protein